jgi:hypothetical protein
MAARFSNACLPVRPTFTSCAENDRWLTAPGFWLAWRCSASRARYPHQRFARTATTLTADAPRRSRRPLRQPRQLPRRSRQRQRRARRPRRRSQPYPLPGQRPRPPPRPVVHRPAAHQRQLQLAIRRRPRHSRPRLPRRLRLEWRPHLRLLWRLRLNPRSRHRHHLPRRLLPQLRPAPAVLLSLPVAPRRRRPLSPTSRHPAQVWWWLPKRHLPPYPRRRHPNP